MVVSQIKISELKAATSFIVGSVYEEKARAFET